MTGTGTGTGTGGNGDGACGDGEQSPGEECDDGNMVDGDGCSSLCVAEAPRWVVLFRHTSIGNDTFRAFDLEEREFTDVTVSQPSFLGVTASDRHVYIMSYDFLYRCEFGSFQCEVHAPAPVWEVGDDGIIEWAGDQICAAYWNTKTLACYQDEKWTTYPLPLTVGYGSSWDPVANELYIQARTTFSSQVVDLDTHEVVRTLEFSGVDVLSVLHEYWDGYVYILADNVDSDTSLHRMNAQTGEIEDTGVLTRAGTGVLRDVENVIYTGETLMTGYRIDRYDPEAGVLLEDPIESSPEKGFRLEMQRRAGL